MLLKTMMACTAIGAGVLLSAGEYLESFKVIVAKGAAESKAKYWQGHHFGDTPFQPNDKIFKGRSSHDFTMTYWNLMDAKLNGNQESLERALTHYHFTVGQFWDEKKNLFRSDYDFLMNTSIALTLCFSLRDAGEIIPAELKEDIRFRLRGIAAYLPTYTTALTNNADLRANNQDSFASLALALISEENTCECVGEVPADSGQDTTILLDRGRSGCRLSVSGRTRVRCGCRHPLGQSLIFGKEESR